VQCRVCAQPGTKAQVFSMSARCGWRLAAGIWAEALDPRLSNARGRLGKHAPPQRCFYACLQHKAA